MTSSPDKMVVDAAAMKQWQIAQQLHSELRAKIRDKECPISEIEMFISQLRLACESTLFIDFDYATEQGVEGVLWDAHTSINSRYRKIIAKIKTSDSKKTVENRKWNKRYVDFLKTSQFYYKGYIQRLASQFNGLKELRIIAHRLSLGTLSAEKASNLSEKTERAILLSCHFALLRLGDLYRYRNDVNVKERSWEKANAHYALANDLIPESGMAFNQMAVISLADQNHLDAVYNLYRALAVKEPHSLAENNLEVEFKKITNNRSGSGQKKDANGNALSPPIANLVMWFVRLHAMLYRGEEFSNHDELENEVLSQMTVLLKEQSLEEVLDKIVLINIAAEYFAGVRLTSTGAETCFQAYYFYLRLNIRMMFMLLQLLQPELDYASQGHDLPDVTGKKDSASTETITAVTRRILPALRHYSTWLVATAPVLASQIGTAAINVHIKEMWSMYCSTLTLLMNAFPPEQLKDVDYLLEEDAATVGFKPFRDCKECRIYTDENGEPKKRSTDPGVERYHPNIEMAARIRGILWDAVNLAVAESDDGVKSYPIYMIDGQFCFSEDGLPNMSKVVPGDQIQTREVPSDVDYEQDTTFHAPQHNHDNYPPSVEPSESQQSLSMDMHQMVDDLLTPSKPFPTSSNEVSYGMPTTSPFNKFDLNPQADAPRQMQRRISGFPGLSSAFAPRPGELGAMSAQLPTGGQRASPFRPEETSSFNTAPQPPQNPFPTGYEGGWNNNSNHVASSQPQRPRYNVAQELQKSLALEYQASGFSNASSIYQNTPAYRQQNNVSRDALPNLQMWDNTQGAGRNSPGGYHR